MSEPTGEACPENLPEQTGVDADSVITVDTQPGGGEVQTNGQIPTH
jgi:hypothetical protein